MHKKPSFILIIIVLIISLYVSAEDKAKSPGLMFEKGSRDWDISLLKKAEKTTREVYKESSAERSLLLGKINFRIAFILFIMDEDPDDYAEDAERHLKNALKYNKDSAEAAWYLTRTYQLLAQGGIFAGPKYGKKAGEATELLKKINADSFYIRFIDAVNYLLTPSMFGGDTKKALDMFSALHNEYPDDEDITAYYIQSLYEEEKYQQGLSLAKEGLQKNPGNLFFKFLQTEIMDEID